MVVLTIFQGELGFNIEMLEICSKRLHNRAGRELQN